MRVYWLGLLLILVVLSGCDESRTMIVDKAGNFNGSGVSNYLVSWVSSNELGVSPVSFDVNNATSIHGNLLIEGDIVQVESQNLSGNIIPTLNNTFTLGNSTKKFSSLDVVSINVRDLNAISGIVGIGTTAPNGTANTKLDVRGHIRSALSSSNGIYYFSSGSTNPYLNYGAIENTWSFGDSNSIKLVINATSGNTGIGVSLPNAKLDVTGGNNLFSIITGSDVTSTTRTDLTRKFTRIGLPHYNNSEEPVTILTSDSDGTNNFVTLGGATGSGNSATAIRFHTATTSITPTGTERMRIDSTGNVVIGTTSASAKFHVNGTSMLLAGATTGTDTIFTITADPTNVPEDDTSKIRLVQDGGITITEIGGVGSNLNEFNNSIHNYGYISSLTSGIQLATLNNSALTIDTTQKVGIGTTTPTQILDVVLNQNAQSQILLNNSNNGTSARSLITARADSGTINLQQTSQVFTAVPAWTNSSILSFSGKDLWIHGTDSDNPNIIFALNGSASSTEKMRITSNGFVGIGTTNPTSRFYVLGGNATFSPLGSGSYGALNIESPISTNVNLQALRQDTGALTRDLSLNSRGGNVGIGTNTPTQKLEVNGNVNVTGNIYVGGCIRYNTSGTAQTLGVCV